MIAAATKTAPILDPEGRFAFTRIEPADNRYRMADAATHTLAATLGLELDEVQRLLPTREQRAEAIAVLADGK